MLATNGTSRRSLADFSAVSSRSNQAVLVSCRPWGNMSSLISILKSSQILYQNWAVPSEHTSLWKLVPCKNPNPLWKNVAVSRFATSQISLLKNVPSDKVHGMITQQLFQALTVSPAASKWKALVLDWKSFIVGRQNAIVARLLSSPWFENIFFQDVSISSLISPPLRKTPFPSLPPSPPSLPPPPKTLSQELFVT